MSTISVPSLTLSAAGAGAAANSFYMQFARADDSIALILSIGSVNLTIGSPSQAWAYAFAPYNYTHSGNPITKCRLRMYNGSAYTAGSWSALSDIAAGAWWITGLGLTSATYVRRWSPFLLAADVALTVAAGTFTDSISSPVAAVLDEATDIPRLHVVSGGEEGRTIAKLKYKFVQSAAAGAWSGTVVGTKVYQLPTPPGD
jgi:hypothetical protein